jgi:hypothetical protein
MRKWGIFTCLLHDASIAAMAPVIPLASDLTVA